MTLLRASLAERLHINDIRRLCDMCVADKTLTETLFSLAEDPDDRTAYNALWVLSHFPAQTIRSRHEWRNQLIDMLLVTKHVGKQRLILALLKKMPTLPEDTRTDYLDFCLAHINSTAPYAIRALSLTQAYAQCRPYPELLRELTAEIELMDQGELSPGLLSARRQILKKLRPAR